MIRQSFLYQTWLEILTIWNLKFFLSYINAYDVSFVYDMFHEVRRGLKKIWVYNKKLFIMGSK